MLNKLLSKIFFSEKNLAKKAGFFVEAPSLSINSCLFKSCSSGVEWSHIGGIKFYFKIYSDKSSFKNY